MLFTMKLVQHSDQNATHVVKQNTGHQYVCQTEQNQNKGRGHKAENTKNQNLTINHNIGENSTWKLMQYTTTKKLRNYCFNMTQKDEAFVLINIKLPNRNGIHKLRLKIDTRIQGKTLPVFTFRSMFSEKLDVDGFPNIKNNLSTKNWKLITARQ